MKRTWYDKESGVSAWVPSNYFEVLFWKILGRWKYHCFRCWLAENGIMRMPE